MSSMTWVNHSGVLTNNQLNKTFQKEAQELMRFRQFVKFKSAFGKHKGQSENWLKVSDAGPATGTRTYGGTLTETNTIPEAKQPMSWGTVTVNEYGLAIPLTFKIQALSEFDVKSIVRESLMNDAARVIDGTIERQFNATLLRYIATASDSAAKFYTNGTATKTNDSGLNTYHLRKMVLKLKQRNVPGFMKLGGEYAFIGSHECIDSMSQNMESINQYTESGYTKILNGEIGKVHGVRFVEDGWATRFNYNPSARTAGTTSTAGNSLGGAGWTNGKSGSGYLFGSPTVREIFAVPEEIRGKVSTDYGRSDGLAWYMIAGWKIEWDTGGGADSRIVKWDSTA